MCIHFQVLLKQVRAIGDFDTEVSQGEEEGRNERKIIWFDSLSIGYSADLAGMIAVFLF
jgi:hypothetical protein